MLKSRRARIALAGAALLLAAGGAPASGAPPHSAAPPARDCTAAEIAAYRDGRQPPPFGYATECAVLAPGRNFNITDQKGADHTCYFGFAYRGADKRNYLSAQGSCYLTPSCLELLGIQLPVCIITAYSEYEPFYAPGKGIPVTIEGIQVGELAYAIYDGIFDFALIRLDPRIPFSPAVCGLGGPTGIETGVRTEPEQLLLSEGGLTSTSVAVRGLYHPVHVGNVTGFPSIGAPLMTLEGKAVGIGVTMGIGTNTGDLVERIPQPLARANYRTKLKLSLLRAPLL